MTRNKLTNETSRHCILKIILFCKKGDNDRTNRFPSQFSFGVFRHNPWTNFNLLTNLQEIEFKRELDQTIQESLTDMTFSLRLKKPSSFPTFKTPRKILPPATPPFKSCTSQPGLFTSNERITREKSQRCYHSQQLCSHKTY